MFCVCKRYLCKYLTMWERKCIYALTYIWMQLIFSSASGCYISLNKSYAASNIEQVMEAAPHKAAAVQPPTTYHENYPSWTNKTCRRSRDELISDVLLWTPSRKRAKAGRPARTYIQQLCTDTGCKPEDLPEAMDDREGSRERVRNIRADSATWWWWWWWWCKH